MELEAESSLLVHGQSKVLTGRRAVIIPSPGSTKCEVRMRIQANAIVAYEGGVPRRIGDKSVMNTDNRAFPFPDAGDLTHHSYRFDVTSEMQIKIESKTGDTTIKKEIH